MENAQQLDEIELIREIQSGDSNAFACLLDQYYEVIYRLAFRWSGNSADAQDITQQACIKLAKGVQHFRFESMFRTWLYRLVVNCAKDWVKAQQRHVSQTDTVFATSEPSSAANEAENAVYLQQIMALLDTMPDGFKETALLVFAEGCSHKEVATALGVKEKTISWRIHEIRKQLSQALSEAL